MLLHAVESGTLADELDGTPAASRAEEATRTVLFALAAGLRAASRETERHVYSRPRRARRGFVRAARRPAARRRRPPPSTSTPFRAAADEFVAAREAARRTLAGHALAPAHGRRRARLARLRRSPVLILRELRPQLDRAAENAQEGHHVRGDDAAWDLWKAFSEGGKKRNELAPRGPVRPARPLARDAARAAVPGGGRALRAGEGAPPRGRPARSPPQAAGPARRAIAPSAREYQGLFDHVFVDEFQDTDPLQAEIVLLPVRARAAPRADWERRRARPGKLTLVGDPKQSIYRFRRADIAVYDRVRQRGGAQARAPRHALRPTSGSVPALIEWLNDRFDEILGRSPDGAPFDPATGRSSSSRSRPVARATPPPPCTSCPCHFPTAASTTRRSTARSRDRRSRAISAGSSTGSGGHRRRSARPAGRARPATATSPCSPCPRATSSLLFPGSTTRHPVRVARRPLFLEDPLNRQFLLGLRALADPDDGVAEAALLRPPFFAVDPTTSCGARGRAGTAIPEDDERAPREARALVRELRRGRLDRSPGATARDLLERTAFARAVALGPNGAQRLDRLRELCLVLEPALRADGLDFDAVTARMREWVDEPVQLDPPHPVGAEAVQILTVHQAKGLEFPVVVLWDGRLAWDTRIDQGAWHMARDERGWAMSLDGLKWDEPADRDSARPRRPTSTPSAAASSTSPRRAHATCSSCRGPGRRARTSSCAATCSRPRRPRGCTSSIRSCPGPSPRGRARRAGRRHPIRPMPPR